MLFMLQCIVNVWFLIVLISIYIKKLICTSFFMLFIIVFQIWLVRSLFKKYRKFCVFSKIIYLFMNIYFVPFKVIPIRYYTLVPTFVIGLVIFHLSCKIFERANSLSIYYRKNSRNCKNFDTRLVCHTYKAA